MTDLVPAVNTLLTDTHKTKSIPPHPSFDASQLNSFLQQSYQINTAITNLLTYLRQIKTPYLSTAPPPRRRQFDSQQQQHDYTPVYLSPEDRQSIDHESQSTLRDINASVSQLASAEAVRHESSVALAQKRRRRGLGMLGQWAAGGEAPEARNKQEVEEDGKEEGLTACREGVIWFLRARLEYTGGFQREMMESRVDRERERSRDLLSMAGSGASQGRVNGKSPVQAFNAGMSVEDMDSGEMGASEQPQLSAEQLQMFEEENQSMLQLYEDRLDQVRTVEASMVSILDLQSTLVANLTIQNEQISQLVGDSFQTEQDVNRGNKELKKASERRSTARMVFWATVVLCGLIVGWDLVRYPPDMGEFTLMMMGAAYLYLWWSGMLARLSKPFGDKGSKKGQ